MAMETPDSSAAGRRADVLVVGAGPVGLMTAVELRRRGVDVVIVESRSAPAPWAKAVGVQPRTLEIFDAIGISRAALDAATSLRGQLTFVNGEQTGRLDLALPADVPYRFVALPQYETERVLGDRLAGLGVEVQRGCEVVEIRADSDGVTAAWSEGSSRFVCRAKYVVGCDGAHSLVRKSLGTGFSGDAFPEAYMLADVEVDWDLPAGYGIRSSHQTAGVTDDLLVCIPLPGVGRYRMSMLVPDELVDPAGSADGVAHDLEAGRPPELRHIQAVLDRLAPQPTTARHMRWSSVFRISHRLADRYSQGRVFLAGDAAHIHPPTGAQGMNTGIQDAYNLGWKLALAVTDRAAPSLLDSYHAERHPIGEEVVGRTVRAARAGIGADETSLERVLLREAQLLVGYPDSPLVSEDVTAGALTGGPVPGTRAPDAGGLRQDPVGFPIRLHDLFRHPAATLLLWANDGTGLPTAASLAARIGETLPGLVECRILVTADSSVADVSGRVLCDATGTVTESYGFDPAPSTAVQSYLVRPDGYVGYRASDTTVEKLIPVLERTYRVAFGETTAHPQPTPAHLTRNGPTT